MLVNQGCASASEAVSRFVGSGFSRAWMNPFAVVVVFVCCESQSKGCGEDAPSSETLFQYRSWKVILASVV